MKIGEVMIKLGFISEVQLDSVINIQNEGKKNSLYSETLGKIMLRKGLITEEQHDKALVEYYRLLSEDSEQPPYVKETAKVAMLALAGKGSKERLSGESKLTIIRQIYEYEEKIAQYEKSISVLQNLEKKRVIVETIEKEKKEIDTLIKRIEILRKDLENSALY